MRQRVALVATLARLYVGVVLIDRECECRGHRRRIVGVVYDHMCQQQCDQRIGYAAGLRPGNMSQIGARSAYLALQDFDPANVSCGSILLQKSKIDRYRESRERGFLDASIAATRCNADAKVRGRFVRNDEVPHIATYETHQRS